MTRWWLIAALALPLSACGPADCFQYIGQAGPRAILLNRCTGTVGLAEPVVIPPAVPTPTTVTTTTLRKTEV
jgi:hypothetical protein